MEKTILLTKKLLDNASSIPHLAHLIFRQDEVFSWDHTACAITYKPTAPAASAFLLHEYCHALLDHQHYTRDIDLLKLECTAWDKAKELAPIYNIIISEDTIEDALDTYRDWLHSRSLCPRCAATGVQVLRHEYRCIACGDNWRVNEARTCSLRRYSTKKRP